MAGNNSRLNIPGYNMDGAGDDERRSHHRGPSVGSDGGRSHSRHSSVHSTGRGSDGAPRAGSRPPSESGRSHHTASRPPSESGKPSSRPASEHGGGAPPAQQQGWPAAQGRDPARIESSKSHALTDNDNYNKNVDLPPEAYAVKLNTPFSRRPGMGSVGKQIRININHFPIEKISTPDVWLYDLSLSPNPTKGTNAIIKKCWESETMQKRLASTKDLWLYNGRNLAWSTLNTNGEPLKQTLDIDAEYGRARPGRDNKFMVILRPATKIRLDALRAYLEGKIDFDNHILECLNFLDHVLRQGPSQRMIPIRRNFYSKQAKAMPMGDGVVEVIKGIFASISMTQSIKEKKLGLGITVDVANTCFWVSQNFEDLVRNYLATLDRRWGNIQTPQMAQLFRPVAGKDGSTPTESEPFKALRKLTKIHFTVTHRGKFGHTKTYIVKRFVFDRQYGQEGANAKNYKFQKKDGTTLTVYDHFKQAYNMRLVNWALPLIETTRAGVFPMEVCHVDMHQRYPFKLDPEQTAKMIKFAVTRPPIRSDHIMQNVNELRWAEDKYLKYFGIQISNKMVSVPARVIPNPEIQFGNSKLNPGVTGRWDLRGKTFTAAGKFPLKNFGIVVVDQCIDKPSVDAFMTQFLRTYKGHGGKIEGQPVVIAAQTRSSDMGTLVHEAYQKIGTACKGTPQLIFFVLKDKSMINYERLKKSADCRFGIVTQCMQGMHVRKNQPQYCSNVAMKVNAKLGGATCRVNATFFKRPTMMIGVDVSHGAPGSPQASMAAVTVSMDKEAVRYAAAVETNGYRSELLQGTNIRSMLGPLVKTWLTNFKVAPEHVFYFRDGVAESQFAHVMGFEIPAVREVIRQLTNKDPKMTVIVATKRHHIRFFPAKGDSAAGDKNGNPLPGTVVEREVTHPFHYDFYLCSHVAIQGTARPVHYHVLHDEIAMSPDELQKMIYQQCYQYIRSTTPVSLHPAIYYAHLAGARGRSHENALSSDKDPRTKQGGSVLGKSDAGSVASSQMVDAMPLLKMGMPDAAHPANIEHIRTTMWFV